MYSFKTRIEGTDLDVTKPIKKDTEIDNESALIIWQMIPSTNLKGVAWITLKVKSIDLKFEIIDSQSMEPVETFDRSIYPEEMEFLVQSDKFALEDGIYPNYLEIDFETKKVTTTF